MNTIFTTLEKLQLTSLETRILFSEKTRDVDDLKVWKDSVSGVIYIDEFYTGDETYIEGAYVEDKKKQLKTGNRDYERITDAKRRLHSNLNLVTGKKLLDFGAGSGDFLRLAKDYCAEVSGVEIQQNYCDDLNSEGIDCKTDIDLIPDDSVDICVSFHVIEHLPDPLKTLEILKSKIVKGGMLLIEVPHANDFLLASLRSEAFKDFTLWSQHLVLHTRDSLNRMLKHVSFKDIQIEGVQRYPLSNHLYWLANGKPGGHKSQLSLIDSPELTRTYESSLAKIDGTDTLVAVAKVG